MGHPVSTLTNLEIDVAHVGHAALRSSGEEAALMPTEGAPRAARPSSTRFPRRRGNETTGREEALDQVVVQQPENFRDMTQSMHGLNLQGVSSGRKLGFVDMYLARLGVFHHLAQ